MNKLGVFIGYNPGQLDPYQGISRLIAFVIKGALNQGSGVTIACPGWLKDDVRVLLEDADIPLEAVKIIATNGQPPLASLWKLRDKFRKRRTSKRKRLWLERYGKNVANFVAEWLSSRSYWGIFLGAAAIAVVTILLAVPIAIAFTALIGLLFARRLIRRVIRSKLGLFFHKNANQFNKLMSSDETIDRMREREFSLLMKKINAQKDIKVWYVPAMFWPEVANIKSKIVMAAPDIVFFDYPGNFRGIREHNSYDRMLKSLRSADHLVCYSENAKQKHFVERCDVPAEKITVIRHGFVDLGASGAAILRQDALDTLHAFIKKNDGRMPEYLKGFRFDDVPFFFYSSQLRPHKNIEGLIRAYAKVLKEHQSPAKLILTAQFQYDKRIQTFIDDNGLHADVLSLHSLPNKVLAALYHLASLSVTPTNFEGGFPFTFSEAYSVGTPSIMSRIPVVQEVIDDPELQDLMTFNPLDVDDIANKMIFGLDNRQRLFEAQSSLYAKLSARTWQVAANDYLSLLKSVAD
ncbi:glycosyltransferase [Brucella melitensis]|uniref:glycosyltransferase n=1 Tax=Brucella melitensis TaxID=29459 RepID=UPI0002FE8BE4|nr:glycosyltransferase [Brucella melitensis]QRN88701.1 glycosyltransferase [Brucella melitensis]